MGDDPEKRLEPAEARMTLEITWPRGRYLEPQVALAEALDGLDESVDIRIDLGHAYAWYDAMQAGAHPDPAEVLTDAQRRSLELLLATWADIREAVNRAYPAKLRPHLQWGGLTVTCEEADGFAFVELSGYTTGEDDGYLGEHGIGAVLLGGEVVDHGERNPTRTRRGRRPDDVPLRPHPDYRELSLQAVRAFADQRDFAGLRAAVRAFDGVEGGWVGAARVLDDWLWSLPPLEAARHARSVAFLLRHGDRVVGEAELGRSLAVLRALVEAKAYRLPGNPLVETTDPKLARRWVAIGAKLQRLEWRDEMKPLWVHRHAPGMFDVLLELGADPRAVVDAYGAPYEPLPDDILRILWRHHPTLQPRPELTQAVEVLDLWRRVQWIELEPEADATAVDAALVKVLTQGREAKAEPEAVVHEVLGIPGVVEVYVSDDALEAFLAAW